MPYFSSIIGPSDSGSNRLSGTLEHRAEFVAGLQHIDRMDFHQRFEPLGERGFAAADRSEQIEDLLALFEALRGMPEEADDALDGFFHAVEAGEGRIGCAWCGSKKYGQGVDPWPCRSSWVRRSQPANVPPHWHIASDRFDTTPDIPPSTCRSGFALRTTERNALNRESLYMIPLHIWFAALPRVSQNPSPTGR